ncbi:MAG: hypothetical protein GY711_09890 [bacterium]|nr:hypothetical protein [bacterium]
MKATLTSLFACAAVFASSAPAQTWDTSLPAAPATLLNYATSVAWKGGENQIFVFGGQTETTSLAGVYVYHRTLYWSTLNSMPAARHEGAAATALNASNQERIYFFGGGIGTTGATTTCWEYDPIADTWNTSLTPMPTPRAGVEAITGPDNWIYVFGGQTASGMALSTVERYDPVTDVWQTLPSMAAPRNRFGASLACDGHIYLFGGDTLSGQLNTVEVFQPGTGFLATNPNTLTAPAPMTIARSGHGAATGRNGRIYNIAGHTTSVIPTATVESYDPYTNSWAIELPLPTNRSGIDPVGLGSRIWVPGGYRKIHPHTPKLESFGALSNLTACGGVVPPVPPIVIGPSCDVAAEVARPGPWYDLVVHAGESSWVELSLQPGQRLEVEFQFRSFDAATPYIYRACGTPPVVVGEPGQLEQTLSYTNDSGALEDVKVEVRYPASGGDPMIEYDMTTRVLSADIGTNYCGPAVPNSSGASAVMSASGSVLVTDNNLRIAASGLPLNQFGYFLTSMGEAVIVNPGGSAGNLCLGGATIARFSGDVRFTGDTGGFEIDVDLLELPMSPHYPVAPGETWNFQAWFRDLGNTSNFTDAVRVAFE